MNDMSQDSSELCQEKILEYQADGGDRNDLKPTHLIIMVNGFIGKPTNWKYAAQQFVEKFTHHNVIVHCSNSNSSMSMFNGIAMMGERLAEEVIHVTSQHPGLQKISFIGHSVGGLIARYAIGCLYGRDRKSNLSEPEEGCGDGRCGGEFNGKIAGLKPMNFITTATPHLGLRAHKQVPLFCGLKMVEKFASLASGLLGETGRNLFLRDSNSGKLPLLLQMTTDDHDLQFLSALKSFKQRVAYANVHGDIFVGRCTASIRRPSELPEIQHFSRNFKYPHIVYTTKVNSLEHSVNVEFEKTEMEEKMIIGLMKAGWELIDVRFNGIKRIAFAHSTMQVKNYCINSDGADVILHMTDNFCI